MVREDVVIPEYILCAIVYASQSVISNDILWKVARYRFEKKKSECDFWEKSQDVDLNITEKNELIQAFCEKYPQDSVARFIQCYKDLS